MSKNNLLICLTIVAVFAISFYGKNLLVSIGLLNKNEVSRSLMLLISYACWLIPSFLMMLVISRFNIKSVFQMLGLTAGLLKGFAFAFAATLPMLIGFYFISQNARPAFSSQIISGAILPGIMEEYLFRGFLFGQLYLNGRLGFITAVLISALPFGLGHLYQGHTLSATFMIFLLTAAGGIWFSWLYIEWDRNLWLIIMLHLFMNAWWIIFPVGETAIGSGAVNIFRIGTIAITVVATIIRGRRVGFKIKKSTLVVFSENT